MTVSFTNDYSEGCHPEVLRRLMETNREILAGYCQDGYCAAAGEKIRTACKAENANVFFMAGGTLTNQTIIDALLRYNEGVISAATGHINTHEAGAIELTGHKILTIRGREGKIQGTELERYLQEFHNDSNNVQMVYPGMVYISYPTEYGTLYRKSELEEISRICKRWGLLLYIDGARLGYGLAAPESDAALEDIAALCDVFYIGGTKLGALCGEAAVFPKGNAPARFSTFMKQHGALLAKGRLLGVQFDALFSNNLYFRIGENAVKQANKLYWAFADRGYRMLAKPQTNQLFVILNARNIEAFNNKVIYRFWERYDNDHIIARFVTSWATKDEDTDRLSEILASAPPETIPSFV